MTYKEIMHSAKSAEDTGIDFIGIAKYLSIAGLFVIAAAIAAYDISSVRSQAKAEASKAASEIKHLREEMERNMRDNEREIMKLKTDRDDEREKADSDIRRAQEAANSWKAKADLYAEELSKTKAEMKEQAAAHEEKIANFREMHNNKISELRRRLSQENTQPQANAQPQAGQIANRRARQKCPDCDGRGSIQTTCRGCSGTGWTTVKRSTVHSNISRNYWGWRGDDTKNIGCRSCSKGMYNEQKPGTGKIIEKCFRCNGTGWVAE